MCVRLCVCVLCFRVRVCVLLCVCDCVMKGKERTGKERRKDGRGKGAFRSGWGIHMYKILAALIVLQSMEFLVNPH